MEILSSGGGAAMVSATMIDDRGVAPGGVRVGVW